MSSHDDDARRLKMAGLVLLAAGLVVAGAVGDSVDDGSRLLSGPLRDVATFVLGWAFGAFLIAIGLILLLAGLKSVPLRTSDRARRGAWQKLAGAALLILCFGYVGLMDLPALRGFNETWWIALPGIVFYLLVAHTAFRWLRSGWKYDAASAEELRARDPRPPVVYLRSFEVDDQILLPAASAWRKWMAWFFSYLVTHSPEQELADVLGRIGPVVAIGKPGEPLPELGAARLYVSDADWQATAIDLMTQSRLLIIRTGSTPSLQWEIDQAMSRVPRRQILLVCLGHADELLAVKQVIERRVGSVTWLKVQGRTTPWDWLTAMNPDAMTIGHVVYFDEAMRAKAEPIHLGLSGSGWIHRPMRPYREPIRRAMKRAIAALDLPGTQRRSQTAAVLLAMFAGVFGAHHFYLGDRRRGFTYLAFFWTLIPMFAGWVDTVKLARLDPRSFDAKYPPEQAAAAKNG